MARLVGDQGVGLKCALSGHTEKHPMILKAVVLAKTPLRVRARTQTVWYSIPIPLHFIKGLVMFDRISSSALQWISRIATGVAMTGLGVTVLTTSKGLGAALAGVATFLLWLTREIGHSRNGRLRAQIEGLGGSLDALGDSVAQNRPGVSVAAAFTGQGELATWNYSTLVARLKTDGYIS